MSNYWNLLCRTCGEQCDLQWNRGGDHIQDLIPHMSDIAKMRAVEEILSLWFVQFGFPADLARFAERHHEHDLVAVDEYGVAHGDCSNRYRCPCCRTWTRCTLADGHDGDCGNPDADTRYEYAAKAQDGTVRGTPGGIGNTPRPA